MRKIAFLFFVALLPFQMKAQIELSKETTKEEREKKKKEKVEASADGNTEVFLSANWSFTTRKLIPNDGFFGDSLGERANETGLGAFSYGIGVRNAINTHLKWEGGIAFLQNGEKYSFSATDSDSTYAYAHTYRYIGMPFKLYYTYGDKIQLMAGVGLLPQMFLHQRQRIEYTNVEGENFEEEQKLKIGFNSFVLSTVFNLGASFKLSESWSISVLPEYRLQFGSSLVKNAPFKHFGRAAGLNVCISIHL
jgi:hypothetical protein